MTDIWSQLSSREGGLGSTREVNGTSGVSAREAKLLEALEVEKQKVEEYEGYLTQVAEAGQVYAVVYGLTTRTEALDASKEHPCALLLAGATLIEFRNDTFHDRLKVGMVVRCIPDKGICGIARSEDMPGVVVTLGRKVDATTFEIEWNAVAKHVRHGLDVSPEEGDHAVVDSTGSVIIRNLGPNTTSHSLSEETGICWDDIGGCDKAKKDLIEAIEWPSKYPDLFKKYNKKPAKGVLLHGPPGVGKTRLGKAVATSISATYEGRGRDTNFIYVKGPELLNKWVGNTEEAIRGLFFRARQHKKKHGYPAVLFIDEGEALLSSRGQEGTSVISKTVVPQFLSEMDGLEDSGCIVIISTNRPDTLDSAVVREGRIDFKVRVPRPTPKDATDIFKIHFRGVPLGEGYSHEDAISDAVGLLYNPVLSFYQFHRSDAEMANMCLAHLVNGAMIANVVERATSRAIYRDIQANSSGTGVTKEDLLGSVCDIYSANRDTDHKEAIAEFTEGWESTITKIERAPRVEF